MAAACAVVRITRRASRRTTPTCLACESSRPAFQPTPKGLLPPRFGTLIRCLFLEHKRTYRAIRGEVPEGEYVLSLDRANIVRRGQHVTVVAWGWVLHETPRGGRAARR